MRSHEVLERALATLEKLRGDPRIIHAEITGSLRRGRLDINDLDLLVVIRSAPAGGDAPAAFEGDKLPDGVAARQHGDPIDHNNRADLFIATPDTYGATLVWSTGPRELNRKLCERAAACGLSFDHSDERAPFIGLYQPDGELVPTPTEEAFFKLLDVPCVPPSWREWLSERL